MPTGCRSRDKAQIGSGVRRGSSVGPTGDVGRGGKLHWVFCCRAGNETEVLGLVSRGKRELTDRLPGFLAGKAYGFTEGTCCSWRMS